MNQPTATVTDKIILVGNDERLFYLLKRFVEQSPCELIPWLNIPSAAEIITLNPSLIIFSTIDHLEESQSLLEHTSAHEIPVMVCISLADEAHAHELGADVCLFHPLSFENFKNAMSGICQVEADESGLETKTSGF